MDWITALRSFVSTVQQGSLSAAGRLLGYSAASVSRHIASIEEELDTQLLKRSSRKLALTEVGEIYYAQVEKILQDLNEANNVIDQMQVKPRGVLKVHSRMLVGQLVLLPHIQEFLEANPDIVVEFMMSNFAVPLVDHDVDIRIGKLEDSSLLARKLITSRRVICASPEYLSARTDIRTPRDLVDHNCMTYRINLGTPVWRFMSADNEVEEIPVRGNFCTEFGYGLRELALSGLGIAMLPDWSVRRQLSEGTLVQLLPSYRVTHNEFEDGVYAVFPASRQTSLKLRLYIDFLVEVFRREFR